MLSHTEEKQQVDDNDDLLQFIQLSNLYQQIHNKVTEEYNKAREERKPLLIVAGELHTSNQSFILEMMLLHVVHNLKINQLALELSPSELNDATGSLRMIKLLDLFSMNGYKNYFLEGNEKSINQANCLIYAKNILGMKIIPVDSEIKNTGSRHNAFHITERDKEILNSCHNIQENTMLIIGAGHMRNLQLSKSLKKMHHVLSISLIQDMELAHNKSSFSEINDPIEFISSSDQLMHFALPQEFNAEKFTREGIQNLIEIIHEENIHCSIPVYKANHSLPLWNKTIPSTNSKDDKMIEMTVMKKSSLTK